MRVPAEQWRPGSVRRLLAAATLAFTSTAGAQAPARRLAYAPPPGANLVEVVAREFSYQMPDTIPAGLTTFYLRDEGTQPHHLMLYRLEGGKTLADAYAALAAGGALPAWMRAAGGPNTPAPGGGESYGTAVLEPGSYIAFCHIPGPDRVLHFRKGMMKAITVTPAARPAAPLPRSDLAVTLHDYGFTFSRPPARGRHSLAVINTGTQAHELILSRLLPGKSLDDVIAWMNGRAGPAPMVPAGGTTDIAPGSAMVIPVDFRPGSYVVVCRVRDARDGRTHDVHGMKLEFAVR